MTDTDLNIQPDEDAGNAADKDQVLRGTVITAVDGATLVLRSASGKNTKTVALQSLKAPNLASREGEEDEPAAFEAREFLRKRVIGKACTFKLTGKDDTRGCDLGNVWIDKDNLALTVAEEGWAIIDSSGEKSEFFGKLKMAADVAQGAHKGIHGTDGHRKINFNAEEATKKFKGKTLNGVVEKCFSGTVVQVTIIESAEQHWVINVSLSGVSSPGFKKNSAVAAYASDAKILTENALLGRDVQVKLDGMDAKQKDSAAGMVWTNETKDVRVDLLKAGLAKATGDDSKFKSLNEAAQAAKVGIWAGDGPSGRSKSSGGDKRRRRSKSPRGSTGKRGGEKTPSPAPTGNASGSGGASLAASGGGGGGKASKPTSDVPKPDRAAPSTAAPANLPDIYVKSFSDKNPWVRATALAVMVPPDLAHPVVFRSVLKLLHDPATFLLPQKPPNDDEKRLLRILRIGVLKYTRWAQVTPQDQKPDEDKEGRQIYWVRDVADKALKMMRAFPVMSDTIKIMKEEAALDKEPPFLLRKWIDSNIPKFDWPAVGKAFEEIVRQFLGQNPVIEPPGLDYVLRSLSDSQYVFVARMAASRNPISYSCLANIFKRNQRGDPSAKAIMEALEKTSQKVGPQALPILSGIGWKSGHRKRCLAIMKKIEEGGSKVATGYMAIWDKSAGQRFAGYVAKGEIAEDELRTVVARARLFKFPAEFPLAEILSRGERDYVLQALDNWDEVPGGTKRLVLCKMADNAPTPRQAYEPLFELGKMGALAKDAKYSAAFFAALTDSLSATDEWQLILPDWDHEGHPLVFFSAAGRRPAGFEEGVLALLRKKLIPASIVSAVLKPTKFKPWTPPNDEVKEMFREAMHKEVDGIEERHKEESRTKKATIKHPSECAVWDLKNRWLEMRKTATLIGDKDYGIKMDVLMRAPNPKIPFRDWF